MTTFQPIIFTHYSSQYRATVADEQMTIHSQNVSTHLIHWISTNLVHHTTLLLTLFSQVSETASTGLRTSISRRVLSCEVQSAHRYRGGGWSLHSDATVASTHIYNHHTPHIAHTLLTHIAWIQLAISLNTIKLYKSIEVITLYAVFVCSHTVMTCSMHSLTTTT